jgi:aminoglycoside 3-N-acetyltransferase
MMMRQTIPLSEVIEQLLVMGVMRECVLLAHTAFSRVTPVEGGPNGLIAALLAAVGPNGALAMPGMSDDLASLHCRRRRVVHPTPGTDSLQ